LIIRAFGFIQIESVKSVVKNQGFDCGSAAPAHSWSKNPPLLFRVVRVLSNVASLGTWAKNPRSEFNVSRSRVCPPPSLSAFRVFRVFRGKQSAFAFIGELRGKTLHRAKTLLGAFSPTSGPPRRLLPNAEDCIRPLVSW
jgi:hypothetical protein